MAKIYIMKIFLCFITCSLAFSQITDGCDLPTSNITGYVSMDSNGVVYYKTPEVLGGWQFNIDGATVSATSGGDSETAGLFVQASGNLVLAFSFSGGSIPVGCGTLINLSLNGNATGLSGLVFSDANAKPIFFEYYVENPGCTNAVACNFNENATVDNGSCIVPDPGNCLACSEGVLVTVDDDSDGVCNNLDDCPLDAYNDSDNDGICGNIDDCDTIDGDLSADFDSDGCDDADEDADDDGDGILDDADTDHDNDGILNSSDQCITLDSNVSVDFDSDGCDDADEDTDDDGDGIPDGTDTDHDNDGILNDNDQCITLDSDLSADFDSDGCDDADEDTDDDNDGVLDNIDNCDTVDGDLSADFDSDGCDDVDEDADDDGDGVLDNIDKCPNSSVGAIVFPDNTNCGSFIWDCTGCTDGQTLAITKINNSMPLEFTISQNYPNPFNPSTNISFNVAMVDEISLVVYDLSGKEVITLVSGVYNPGSYIANWNAVNNGGESVSSGMYVYRYESSEGVITKKMLYLK